MVRLVVEIVPTDLGEQIGDVVPRLAGGLEQAGRDLVGVVGGVVVVYAAGPVVAVDEVQLGGADVDGAARLVLAQLRHPELYLLHNR